MDVKKIFRVFCRCFFILLLAVFVFSCSAKFDYQTYSRAKDLYIKGETEKALGTLEKLEKNPRFLLPYLLDGRISLFSGDHERSESRLLHVLDRSPLNFDAVRWMTQVYLATDRPEKARELAEKALKRYPEEPRLLLALASAHKKLGNFKDATATFKKAFLFEEELAYSHFELATLYAGFALWDEYKKQLEKALLLSSPESKFNKSVNEILKKRTNSE